MPSTRDIKRRQKSVGNTKQVTKAMQMVSASKMRRSQLVALESRPYEQKAKEILANVKLRQPDVKNIYLDGPATDSLLTHPPNPLSYSKRGGAHEDASDKYRVLALIITSDKGLCGGLNSSVLKECADLPQNTDVVLVGIRSKSYFERSKAQVLETYKGAGDYVELEQIKPIADFIQDKYKTGEYTRVIAIYTEFISTLKQSAVQKQILPIIQDSRIKIQESSKTESEHIFEPNTETVLNNLIPFLLDIHIYHIILESNASEHSARMVAMKNATDSAEKILGELTLSYNKARQAGITREITEISAGVEALQI